MIRFTRALKAFMKNDFTTITNKFNVFRKQAKEINDIIPFGFKVRQGTIMLGGGVMTWLCLDERKRNDKRFEKIKTEFKEVKDLILSSNTRK